MRVVRSARVLAVCIALALSGCAPMPQARNAVWAPTTLSSAELSSVQAAVADVAGTHVFDWNTVDANRRGQSLRLLVQALPEPQKDGSIAEPLADCARLGDGWDCEVRIVRSLFTDVDAPGAPQRVLAFIDDGVATADVVPLLRTAFEVLPAIGVANECPHAANAEPVSPEQVRAAFARRPTRLPLVVARDEAGPYVRSLSFNLNFSARGSPPRAQFECWSYSPTW